MSHLYRTPGTWLNDPRLFYHDGIYHMFHLQEPDQWPPLPYEEMAHAVSDDLLSWRATPLVLKPGEPGSWDDRAIYTSGYVHHDGRLWTLYTGLSNAEDGRVQRIGIAWTEDLKEWHRHPDNPVLQPDPRWYEADIDTTHHGHLAWRDPWLYRHDDGIFYAFLTARTNGGPSDRRGCIGLAKSEDLIHWECLPPAYAPGREPQHEIPELFRYDDHWVLIFATAENDAFGLKYITSTDPLQWDPDDPGQLILGGQVKMEYSLTTAPVGDEQHAVHLLYQWRKRGSEYEVTLGQGSVSLPKIFAGPPSDIHLRIRDDIRPRACDSLEMAHLVGDGWRLEDEALSPTAATIPNLRLRGEGPRAVSIGVSVRYGSAGFDIGDDALRVGLTSNGTVEAISGAVGQRRRWAASSGIA